MEQKGVLIEKVDSLLAENVVFLVTCSSEYYFVLYKAYTSEVKRYISQKI